MIFSHTCPKLFYPAGPRPVDWPRLDSNPIKYFAFSSHMMNSSTTSISSRIKFPIMVRTSSQYSSLFLVATLPNDCLLMHIYRFLVSTANGHLEFWCGSRHHHMAPSWMRLRHSRQETLLKWSSTQILERITTIFQLYSSNESLEIHHRSHSWPNEVIVLSSQVW